MTAGDIIEHLEDILNDQSEPIEVPERDFNETLQFLNQTISPPFNYSSIGDNQIDEEEEEEETPPLFPPGG